MILEGRTAATGQRVGPMIDADMQFHHMIYAASGNPLIAATVNHHWRHIRRAMGAVLQSVGVRHAPPAFPNPPFPRSAPDFTPGGPTLSHPEVTVQATRRRVGGARGLWWRVRSRRGREKCL